jgi:hypothetical protein
MAVEYQMVRPLVTLESGAAVGDVVFLASASTFTRAQQTVVASMPALAVITEKVTSTTGHVANNVIIYRSTWSFTAGAEVYVSSSVGAITSTAPVNGIVQCVGIAIDTNKVWFFITPFPHPTFDTNNVYYGPGTRGFSVDHT